MAMAIMAPTLKPIGTGLGYIVAALNKLGPDGEKKAKAMEGIAGALSKLGAVGKSIFAFAGVYGTFNSTFNNNSNGIAL
jgi:hypothetical protein